MAEIKATPKKAKTTFPKLINTSYHFSFQKLIAAYYECRRKKRLKPTSAEFEFNLEKELVTLEKSLRNHSYKPLPFSVFVVPEPKIREIFAASFRDRVVHHLLYHFLCPIFEPKFIFDSFACRKDKGTHRAIKRLFYFIRKTTRKNTNGVFFLQADIKNFFCSINHDILLNLIQKQVKNPQILWLTKTIIYHDCTQNPVKKGQLSLFSRIPPQKSLFNAPLGQGLPIGNLTSQFFANLYLNELNQFVKHILKCRYYIRYVDDFIILDASEEKLSKIKMEIERFLREKLNLELHPEKWKIKNISAGIDALGYIVKPTHILVRQRVITAFTKKLFEFKSQKPDLDDLLSCVNAYFAHFSHADSYHLRKRIWKKHFGVLKKILRPADGFRYFKLK